MSSSIILYKHPNFNKYIYSLHHIVAHGYNFSIYHPIYDLLKNNYKEDCIFKSRFILNTVLSQQSRNDYRVVIYDTKYKKYKYRTLYIKDITVVIEKDVIEMFENIDIDTIINPSFYTKQLGQINSIYNPCYIESFIGFLLSECVTNSEIHHFPIYYGSYSYNYKSKGKSKSNHCLATERMVDDITYIFSKKYNNQRSGDNQSDDSPQNIDDGDGDGENKKYCNNQIIGYIFQIIYSLKFMWTKYKITHNDLHLNNIMFKYTEQKFIVYKHKKKTYKISTYGKLLKIIDFGRACLTYNGTKINNNIFDKDNICYTQYYLKKYKIHRKSIEPRPINDVIMFINDIKTRFELSNLPEIQKLCDMILTDKDGKLHVFPNNFFKYIEISRIDWKESIDSILSNEIFMRFVNTKT